MQVAEGQAVLAGGCRPAAHQSGLVCQRRARPERLYRAQLCRCADADEGADRVPARRSRRRRRNIRANLQDADAAELRQLRRGGVQRASPIITRGDAAKAFAEREGSGAAEAVRPTRRQAASKAMRDLATWLEGQRATATQDFALGADQFSRMVGDDRGRRHAARPARGGGPRRPASATRTALNAACAQYRAGHDDPGVHGQDEREQAGRRPGRRGAAADPELRAVRASITTS